MSQISSTNILNSTGGGVNASQTVSLNKRCQDVILQSACLPSVRENVLVPILEYLAREAEPKMTLKDEPIKVMWHLVRQGALLCELLNQCQPGVIPSVSFPIAPMGPTNFSDANSRQNVATFIKSSRDMFFYTDEFLFNPGDLYRDDFNALSKAVTLCERYLENKIRVSSRNSYRVEDLVLEPEIALLFETTNTRRTISKENVSSNDLMSKRERLLEEMIASERVYVDDLDRLSKYRETLKFFKLLPQNVLDSIFSNLKDLLNFQRRFMIEMENQIQKENPDFANLFTVHEADFALYEIFCLNQPVSLLTLEKHKSILESRPDLSENISGNVQGYLIKPIQRVPRYQLFLRDLIKEARKKGDEVEAKNFEIAAESAKRIANRINERKRMAENEQAAQDFFEQFHPMIMNPQKTGKLVLFDKAMRLKLDNNDLKVHQVFLFQKKLIMCSEKREKVMGKFWIKSKIGTDSVKEVRDLVSSDPTMPYEAEITCSMNEKDVTFSLLFRTQQAERMWIDSLRGLANLPALEYAESEKIIEPEAKEEEEDSAAIDKTLEAEKTHKCRVKFLYREEYFAFVVNSEEAKTTRLELAAQVRAEIEKSFRLESQSVTNIPPVDRIRLRYKDSDGSLVRLSNDELVQTLLAEKDAIDLVVYEGDPVRVRFKYRDCLYTFTVDTLTALEELKIYIYETIAEDYRMLNANMDAVPKGDAMRLFVRESDGQWSLLLYDNDLEVALSLSNRVLDIKF